MKNRGDLGNIYLFSDGLLKGDATRPESTQGHDFLWLHFA